MYLFLLVLICFNPYFTGLPILIYGKFSEKELRGCFNPYFTGLPILIIREYSRFTKENFCFNPYFTGLPILILL